MSDERGDEKGKRARRTMTQEDMETSRLEAVECRRPLAATRQEQPEAKDKTRHITTCSRKFDMKNTAPAISESSFNLRADGWLHLENEGVHQDEMAGVVPVLDDEAWRRIVNRINTEADQPGFPGMLMDDEGRGGSWYFQQQATHRRLWASFSHCGSRPRLASQARHESVAAKGIFAARMPFLDFTALQSVKDNTKVTP